LVRTRSLRRKKTLLKDKNAVIYGGGGSIGGAVARAFARDGANVFLAGRRRAKLEEVSDEILRGEGPGDRVHRAEVSLLLSTSLRHAEDSLLDYAWRGARGRRGVDPVVASSCSAYRALLRHKRA
jgi:NAD(P)-dependent dehydrogenase (short-subunit alcohol dehydrogenase family)